MLPKAVFTNLTLSSCPQCFYLGKEGREERRGRVIPQADAAQSYVQAMPRTPPKNVLPKQEETSRPASYLILLISSTFAKDLGSVMLCSTTCIMESHAV